MAGCRILVIDDELHVVAVVSACLERAGYVVEKADGAEEALKVARDAPPDLVITDYVMQEMDGLELVRRLREVPGMAGLPVIMVTARGHCLPMAEVGACNISVISKPFSPSQLVEAVRGLLARRGRALIRDSQEGQRRIA